MHRIAKAVAAVLLAANATGAAAGVIYEAQGSLYDIETVSGLLSALRPTIERQPWFGNDELARALANEVRSSLGRPNTSGMYGPIFATSIYDAVLADYTSGWVYYPNRRGLPEDNRAQMNNFSYSNTWTFAVGSLVGPAPTPVPEPPHLAFVGLAMMLLVRRRWTQNGQVDCSRRASREVA